MQYSISLSVFFCLLTFAAHTQDIKPHPNLPRSIDSNIVQKEVQSLKGILKLTDSQNNDLEAVFNEFYGEYVTLPNAFDSGVSRRTKIEQLQTHKEQALKSMLSPAQWQIYMSYLAEQRKKLRDEIEQRKRKFQEANSGK